MGDPLVFTYPAGEWFRHWVLITVTFLMGTGILLLEGALVDRLLAIAFCWFLAGYGCFLERGRRRRPMRIVTSDQGITALWNHEKKAMIPWAEVSKVIVEQQPYRDDLKKVIVTGRPPSVEIAFTHRIKGYKELFHAIRHNAAQAEFEEVYLWRRKKMT